MLSSASNGTSASGLARQPSIYSLTLDEIQTAMNEPGKPFGSMNMEEFMRNLWTADESQAMISATASSLDTNNLARQPSLPRLNSLSLPAALSRKTVEDVWRDIQRQPPADLLRGQRQRSHQQKRQMNLGEMTLEDFLSKAGAFRDDPDASANLNGGGNMSLYSAGLPSASGVSTYIPASIDPLTSPSLQADWMNFSSHHQHQQMLQQAEADAAEMKRGQTTQALINATGNSSLYNGLSDRSGLGQEPLHHVLALSPSVSEYAMPGRKRVIPEVFIEKTVERRQKRMMKNRESAARSRARKQAYTVELEEEVSRLKHENARLKEQQASDNLLPETWPSKQLKVRVLRRVRSW